VLTRVMKEIICNYKIKNSIFRGKSLKHGGHASLLTAAN